MSTVPKLPVPEFNNQSLVAHPFANMFPMIEGQEFENLKASRKWSKLSIAPWICLGRFTETLMCR